MDDVSTSCPGASDSNNDGWITVPKDSSSAMTAKDIKPAFPTVLQGNSRILLRLKKPKCPKMPYTDL